MSLPVTTLTPMGYFANLKAKRADKAATNEYNRLHAIWQEDVETLTKLITVFTAASKGEDSVPNTLMQKAGERTLWTATGIFHEYDGVQLMVFEKDYQKAMRVLGQPIEGS